MASEIEPIKPPQECLELQRGLRRGERSTPVDMFIKWNNMSEHNRTRREFCIHACHGATLALLSGTLSTILQSCSKSDNPLSPNGGNIPTIQGSVANGVVTVNIDANSPLSSVGSAALVQYSGGLLLVARTGQSSFTALTSVCTHAGCTVNEYANQIYTCLCHGSQYNIDGQVVRGPATNPLRVYQTQFSSNALTISLA